MGGENDERKEGTWGTFLCSSGKVSITVQQFRLLVVSHGTPVLAPSSY